MTRWTLRAEVTEAALEVKGWRGGELLRAVGSRPVWLGSRRVWSTDVRFALDFVALAESRGAAVAVEGLPIKLLDKPNVRKSEQQMTLFGIAGDAG